MSLVDSNRWYAKLLGWGPADVGSADFDVDLVVKIRESSNTWKVNCRGVDSGDPAGG